VREVKQQWQLFPELRGLLFEVRGLVAEVKGSKNKK
jgi:hypothetical protein